jgi:hypothetical protein
MAKLEDLEIGIFIVMLIVVIVIFVHHRDKKNFVDITKSCILGLLRGFLTGLLLSGLEGAIVTSITLGLVNVLITVLEPKLE